MKIDIPSATMALSFAAVIVAAPPNEVKVTKLSKREVEQLNSLTVRLNTFARKRDAYSPDELQARAYESLTDILKIIKDTNLGAPIIEFLTTNSTTAPVVTKAIVALVKSGKVNLTTLFTALNNSGLAVQVVDGLVHDCQFYAEIFKLAENYISNLGQKIHNKLTGKSKRDATNRYLEEVQRRNDMEGITLYKRADSDNSVLENVLESLKDSGLAVQVVDELVTDPSFLKWGADLIEQLFKQKAITVPELIEAIAQSGLVPSLIKEFLQVPTLKAIVENALAAAFGDCGNSSLTTSTGGGSETSGGSSPTSEWETTTTKPTSKPTSSPTGKCRRRKRRSYNY